MSDVIMPRLGGPEFIARLRELRPVRVVFMSGYHERERELAHEVVLSKPFTSDVLVAAVVSALA